MSIAKRNKKYDCYAISGKNGPQMGSNAMLPLLLIKIDSNNEDLMFMKMLNANKLDSFKPAQKLGELIKVVQKTCFRDIK